MRVIDLESIANALGNIQGALADVQRKLTQHIEQGEKAYQAFKSAPPVQKEMNVADPAGPERLKMLNEAGKKLLGKDSGAWIWDQLEGMGVPKGSGSNQIQIKHVAEMLKRLLEIEKKDKARRAGEEEIPF